MINYYYSNIISAILMFKWMHTFVFSLEIYCGVENNEYKNKIDKIICLIIKSYLSVEKCEHYVSQGSPFSLFYI